MADWMKNVNRMAQSAITKGKEAAEMNRINGEIRAQEQKVNAEMTLLGRYIAQNLQLLQERDGVINGILERIDAANDEIAALNTALLDIRGVRICGKCGIEVSKDCRFCGSCGNPMEPIVTVEAAAPAPKTCAACGAQVEEGTAFCGNCGAKIS